MMKNHKQIELHFIPTVLHFTIGRKSYEKITSKISGDGLILENDAETSEYNGNGHYVVIGVNYKNIHDIYDLKGLVVHEISHAVTMIMERHGFTCDEFRSYLNQYIYIECIKYLDKKIQTKD